ncbi:MAG: glycosyltransferase [Pseudomonadota bacterium]
MKILFYCQHVLGVGHFFRGLEICRALDRHQVVMAVGGPPLDHGDLGRVKLERLPELSMDAEFKTFRRSDPHTPLAEIRAKRKRILAGIFDELDPDVFIVELYPFGRKAFRFELDPLLEKARIKPSGTRLTVCSLRDILVEKKDQAAYEARVVETLNKYFDALLVHSDPVLIDLNRTFAGLDRLKIPLVYTGFVAAQPRPGAREDIRTSLGLKQEEKLIVAAAGGGAVGFELLAAASRALTLLPASPRHFLQIFSGPFMSDEDFEALRVSAGEGIRIERFTPDYTSWLAAADLSLSLAGYNTTMNILAAGVPALVLPFAQNREQRMRAEAMARLGALEILSPGDLDPDRLAGRITAGLEKTPARPGIDLDGAARTALWLENRMREKIR